MALSFCFAASALLKVKPMPKKAKIREFVLRYIKADRFVPKVNKVPERGTVGIQFFNSSG
jgi:hypothetical protein